MSMMIVDPYRFTAPITYTTLNPADKHSSITLSGGNLVADFSDSTWRMARGVDAKTSGKYYFEVAATANGAANSKMVGVTEATRPLTSWIAGWSHLASGYFSEKNSTFTAYGYSWETLNDVIMVAVDVDNGVIRFGRNGVWPEANPGDPDFDVRVQPATTAMIAQADGSPLTLYPAVCSSDPNNQLTCNFGATAFVYSVPDTYTAGWPAN